MVGNCRRSESSGSQITGAQLNGEPLDLDRPPSRFASEAFELGYVVGFLPAFYDHSTSRDVVVRDQIVEVLNEHYNEGPRLSTLGKAATTRTISYLTRAQAILELLSPALEPGALKGLQLAVHEFRTAALEAPDGRIDTQAQYTVLCNEASRTQRYFANLACWYRAGFFFGQTLRRHIANPEGHKWGEVVAAAFADIASSVGQESLEVYFPKVARFVQLSLDADKRKVTPENIEELASQLLKTFEEREKEPAEQAAPVVFRVLQDKAPLGPREIKDQTVAELVDSVFPFVTNGEIPRWPIADEERPSLGNAPHWVFQYGLPSLPFIVAAIMDYVLRDLDDHARAEPQSPAARPAPQDGEKTDRPTRCEREAHNAFLHAREKYQSYRTMWELYCWLREHGFKDYVLPSFETWAKYVRTVERYVSLHENDAGMGTRSATVPGDRDARMKTDS